MSLFTNNQSLVCRCQILMSKLHKSIGNSAFSGKFGSEFNSRLEIKKLLNDPGGCDAPSLGVELKTILRPGGCITVFEITTGEFFEWSTDPYSFLKKYGTKEKKDGWNRHDRRLDVRIDNKYFYLSYDGTPLVRMPVEHILQRFNKKLRKVILVEGHKASPNSVVWDRLTLVQNPKFTKDILLMVFQLGTVKVESRIKTNEDKSKLVHRFIFKTTAKHMKEMTPNTQTPIQQESPTKALDDTVANALNDCAVPLGQEEVLSSKIPDDFGIEFTGSDTLKVKSTVLGVTDDYSWTVENVTPARAQELLDLLDKGKQRKVRPSKVRSLRLSFEQGRIALTGDSIILENGKLIQGQHRLWAIVESGKTVPCLICRTTNKMLYDLIDDVLPRGFADRVDRTEPNSQAIGAAINSVRRYDQGAEGKRGLTYWGGDVLHCKSDQKAYWLKHTKSLREAVSIAKECKRVLFSVSTGTAFLELAWRNKVDKQTATDYLTKLIRGTNIREGSAVHTLRAWLERENSDSSKRCRPEMIFAQIVLAWNAQQTHTKYSAPKKPSTGKRLTREERRFPRFYWEKPLPVATKATPKRKARKLVLDNK